MEPRYAGVLLGYGLPFCFSSTSILKVQTTFSVKYPGRAVKLRAFP